MSESKVRRLPVDLTGVEAFVLNERAAAIFRLLHRDGVYEAARAGARCAALTVESPQSVREDLNAELLGF